MFHTTKIMFWRAVAYVELPDSKGQPHVYRFYLNQGVRKQIEAFDLGGRLATKTMFTLKAPTAGRRFDSESKRDAAKRFEERRTELRRQHRIKDKIGAARDQAQSELESEGTGPMPVPPQPRTGPMPVPPQPRTGPMPVPPQPRTGPMPVPPQPEAITQRAIANVASKLGPGVAEQAACAMQSPELKVPKTTRVKTKSEVVLERLVKEEDRREQVVDNPKVRGRGYGRFRDRALFIDLSMRNGSGKGTLHRQSR
jgi:hypothetical protein